MVRLFVALPITETLREQLAGLAGGIPGARWVPPQNYHVTLRFIGEVENVLADELDEALATIRGKPFELTLRGMDVFEKAGRIQSLYVGVERCERLLHLQSKVETALQRAGLPPERKKFTPHITLARTDRVPPEKLIAFVQAHNLFRAVPEPMDRFCLFSSRLGKEQAHYVMEVDYALQGSLPFAATAEDDPASELKWR